MLLNKGQILFRIGKLVAPSLQHTIVPLTLKLNNTTSWSYSELYLSATMSWSYSEMYLPPAKPLPFNPYNLSSEPEWYNAYQWCLQIEPHCLNDKGQDLVYARILGYLILKAPTSEGRNYISNEILSCDKAELYELAEVFLSGVLTLCKSYIPRIGLYCFDLKTSQAKLLFGRK